jgi:hypothetical protein
MTPAEFDHLPEVKGVQFEVVSAESQDPILAGGKRVEPARGVVTFVPTAGGGPGPGSRYEVGADPQERLSARRREPGRLPAGVAGILLGASPWLAVRATRWAGLNAGYEAVDRHATGARAGAVALRFRELGLPEGDTSTLEAAR